MPLVLFTLKCFLGACQPLIRRNWKTERKFTHGKKNASLFSLLLFMLRRPQTDTKAFENKSFFYPGYFLTKKQHFPPFSPDETRLNSLFGAWKLDRTSAFSDPCVTVMTSIFIIVNSFEFLYWFVLYISQN